MLLRTRTRTRESDTPNKWDMRIRIQRPRGLGIKRSCKQPRCTDKPKIERQISG